MPLMPVSAKKSKTIRDASIGGVAAVASLVLHYTGAVTLPPEALGVALTAVLGAVWAVWRRGQTTGPVRKS
jgi:hypothetical protein